MPNLPAGINIPEMLHPMIVHFAIAIPVILLLLEIANFIFRRKSLGFINFILMLLTFVVFVLAYYTGIADYSSAKDLMSPEAEELLISHRNLGIALIYGSGIILLIKLFGFATQKFFLKLLFFIGILAFLFGIFKVGQMGGKLVYNHGTNVMSHATPESKAVKSETVVTPAVAAPNVSRPTPEPIVPASVAPVTKTEAVVAPSAPQPTPEPIPAPVNNNPVSVSVPVPSQSQTSPVEQAKEATENVSSNIQRNAEKITKEVADSASKVTDAVKKSLDGAVDTLNGAIKSSVTPTN